VSSIVPEMSLWSSSLRRMREKRGMRKMQGGREGKGQGLPALEYFTGLAEAGLEVTGYPPPLPFAPGLKSPSAPLCQPSAFLP